MATIGALVLACSRAPQPAGAAVRASDGPASVAGQGAVAPAIAGPAPAIGSPAPTGPTPAEAKIAEAWMRPVLQDLQLQLMRGPARDVDTALARTVLAIPGADRGELDAMTAHSDAELGEAARLAPDDADVAWAEATRCSEDATTCSRAGALERLMRLEPDNAAVWLLAADAVDRADDPAAVDDYLAQAAASHYFDEHYGAVALALDRVLARYPLPARTAAQDRALRAAMLNPGNAPLSDADIRFALAAVGGAGWPASSLGFTRHCSPPSPSQYATCASVLRVMSGGDTMAARMTALANLLKLTQGTPDQTLWRERYRQHLWLMQQWPKDFGRPDLVRAGWANGEVAALEDWLGRRGSNPPPGWLPADPHQRAAILGEPPPSR